MKITIAKTAGFCMGVRRAVDMVLDASNLYNEPIFTYGPLIHNPQVLAMLESKRIFRLDSIPENGRGVVLIRAHGVPPEDENALSEAGFTVINATCPRVVRVQVIINKFAKKGYDTIIIGDEKHPEVVGLLGYARGQGHTVTSLEQLEQLPLFDHAVVVAQTTQNTGFYDEIKSWCRVHAPHYELFDTICGSTERRQNEVRELARSHDAVIVVGGKQSGNTRRLAQVAQEAGTQASHIEDASEIDYDSLAGARSVAITAGASTPNWIIEETCRTVTRALQKKNPLLGRLAWGQHFLLVTNLLLAFGAFGLTLGAAAIQGGTHTGIHGAIALFYILSMQIMNNMLTTRADAYNKPERAGFYRRHRKSLKLASLASMAMGLFLAYRVGPLYFAVLLVMTVLGSFYTRTIIPSWVSGRIHRLKDIPGSKTVLIAVAWGIVTSLLPAISTRASAFPAVLAFGFSTGLVFARTAFTDLLAVQGDRIAGRETLPILLGEKKSLSYIRWTLAGVALLPIVATLADSAARGVFWLAIVPVFMLLLIKLYRDDSLLSGSPYEFLFEASFIVAGGVAVLL